MCFSFAVVKNVMEVKYAQVARLSKILTGITTKYNCEIRGFLPKQIDCLLKAASTDLLAVLPTAYGKTIIIQSLPFISDAPGKVIVASPLNAIIAEQACKFGSDALVVDDGFITSLKIGQHNEEVEKFLKKEFTFLLGHPEHLTDELFLKQLSLSQVVVSHVVVDEAHCVLSYGLSQFRPSYLRLKYLRCFAGGCKYLALTATASPNNAKLIAKELGMNGHDTVVLPPDRSNIFICVKKRPASSGSKVFVEDSYDYILDSLTAELVEEGQQFKKTIVYLPLKWCAYGHKKVCDALGIDYNGSDDIDDNGLLASPVAQYHAPQGTQV